MQVCASRRLAARIEQLQGMSYHGRRSGGMLCLNIVALLWAAVPG
jgi:hypothetical protein